MKQKDRELKKAVKGAEGFDAYYAALYGARWEKLKSSLAKEPLFVKVEYPSCEPYFMDAASICAALALPMPKEDEGGGTAKILDLCAAPGGKSLVIAGNMGSNAVLYSNERSPDRKKRLDTVLCASLPSDICKNIVTSCSDGATWCKKEESCFSAILLDAPCSSERHVLSDAKYLAQWSPSRIKSLASEQWALLSSAWRLLSPASYMVYSTCALADDENDGVIERLIKKFPQAAVAGNEEVLAAFESNLQSFQGGLFTETESADGIATTSAVSVIRECFANAEKTRFGRHIMPDSANGAGPIYFTVLKKE